MAGATTRTSSSRNGLAELDPPRYTAGGRSSATPPSTVFRLVAHAHDGHIGKASDPWRVDLPELVAPGPRRLNACYRAEPALHALDCAPSGFAWIDCNDAEQSVLALARYGPSPEDMIVVACNFTPVPRLGYRIGVPRGGHWRELLNSDASVYGGSGHGNLGSVRADDAPFHGQPRSIKVTLPPLGIVFFKAPDP